MRMEMITPQYQIPVRWTSSMTPTNSSDQDGIDSMEEVEETNEHHEERCQRSPFGNFQKSYAEVCTVGGESGDCSWKLGNEVDRQSIGNSLGINMAAGLKMIDQPGRIGLGQFVGPLNRGMSKANEEQDVGLMGESPQSQQNGPAAKNVTGDLPNTNNKKSIRERKWKGMEEMYCREENETRWVTGKNRGRRKRRNQLRKRSNSSRIIGLSLFDSRIEQ
ncbi:hypothetical protein SLE2022_255830 [Rubroshorea leprosula]